MILRCARGAWRSCAGGGAIGAAFFIWIHGSRLLQPGEFGWLMTRDWRIHFLGWHFFRREPWQWPPGRIAGYFHAPDGTAIGFTDSIPLLAVPLKLAAPLLADPFQYVGLWLLACFTLQGMFGALLTRMWTPRIAPQLLGAALFVLMPTLLIRVDHPALCAHFLLLWAIWLYWNELDLAATWLFGLVAGLTHPYLAVMAIAILSAALLRQRSLRALAASAGSVTLIAAGWWASGLFTVTGTENLASEGLGFYSMNLAGPIAPTGRWSTLLPASPIADTRQAFEGFQYLGIGTIALVGGAAAIAISRSNTISWRAAAPLAGSVFLCAVYSLSPRVTLASRVLWEWSPPALDRFALFRASGRFFWPAAYALLCGAIAVVVTRVRPAYATAFLAAAVALQMVDLQRVHAERRAVTRSDAFYSRQNWLPSAAWHEALPHYDHLVLVPARQCGSAPIGFESPAYLAGLHHLTINSAEVARYDVAKTRTYCAALEHRIANGDVDDRSLYILDTAHAATLRAHAREPVVCGTIDAALVCVTSASYAPWRDAARLQ